MTLKTLYIVWCADDPTDPEFAWSVKNCKTANEADATRGMAAALNPNPQARYFITRETIDPQA